MSEKAMGSDGSKAAETVGHLEKVYGAGRDLTQPEEYSRMWLHFLGDNVGSIDVCFIAPRGVFGDDSFPASLNSSCTAKTGTDMPRMTAGDTY